MTPEMSPELRAEIDRQLAEGVEAHRLGLVLQHLRWLAWAHPEGPSSMRDEPLLATLRARTESGETHADLDALDHEIADQRECRVDELPWNESEEPW